METQAATNPYFDPGPGRRPASRAVVSAQSGPHPRLGEVVARHRESPWRAPFHRPTVRAFQRLSTLFRPGEADRLVLDSGCGTGSSTRRLGERHPDAVVVGVDQSAARLRRGGIEQWPCRQDNCIWLRGELGTFWRLAAMAGWRLHRHYLLYPNPWPKAAHLKRRWHGHPVFPHLLALGGALELRCNWKTYADEFALAASLATGQEIRAEAFSPTVPLTPFEAKYARSGHRLYRVRLGQG